MKERGRFCILLLFLLALAGKTNPLKAQTATYWLGRGDSLFRMPFYDKASEAFEKAYGVAKGHNDQYGELEAVIRLATLDNIATRTSSAMKRLKDNSNLMTKLSAQRPDLHALYQEERGRAYEDRGDIEKAGEHYRKAMQIKLKLYGEEDARTAYSIMLMGRYHNFKGVYDSALYYSVRAYRICERNPKNIDKIRYVDLLLQHAFDFKNGLEYEIDKHLNITKLSPRWDRNKAKPIDINGFVFFKITDNNNHYYEETRSLYRKAISVAQQQFSFPSVESSRGYQGLANTYTDRLWFEISESTISGKLTFDSARTNYEKAIAINQKIYGSHHKMIAISNWTLGMAYGLYPDTNYVLRSLDLQNTALKALIPGFNPMSAYELPPIRDNDHIILINSIITSKSNSISLLYTVTKNPEYLDHLHRINKYRFLLWEECIRHLESDETGATIGYFSNQPFESMVYSSSELFDQNKDTAYLDELFDALERRRTNDLLEQRIRTQDYLKKGLVHNSNKTATIQITGRRTLQQALVDSNTAYISLSFLYPPGDSTYRVYALVISKDVSIKLVYPYAYFKIDSLLKSYQSSIEKGDASSFVQNSYRLYRHVFEPVISRLPKNINQLILSTGTSYHSIPFDALITDSVPPEKADFRTLPYLIRKYKIQYAVSASHLVHSMKQDLPDPVSIRAFVPEMKKHAGLPFSKNAVLNMKKEFAGVYFFSKDASIDRFRKEAGSKSILLLVSHAKADMGQSNASFLLFSGEPDEDTLFLSDIYSMNIRSPLTVISACETARGKDVYAEGSKSFARSFISSGSLSTLSTLWKVDDKATASLISFFYEGLMEGLSKPEALQRARLRYIESCRTSEAANPFFWSGLVLSGDPRPLNIEKQSPFTRALPYIKVGGVVFILLALGWRIWKNDSRRAA